MGTESDNKLKLYIRLPIRIDEELQIKELHPDISRIWLPRQKSRRWCIIQFPNIESLKLAKADLKKKKINGKKIFIGPFKQGKKKEKKSKQKEVDQDLLLSLLNHS